MTDSDRLYELLPQVYRRRDAESGEPLRALMSVLSAELRTIEQDIEGLHEDWFIETCAEWVVPYIGDLLGVKGMAQTGDASTTEHGFTTRAYVANTIGYRRRKGTAAVLEALARDITGWPARVVEVFERLDTTQHVNHVRLHAPRTVDVRNVDAMDRVDGPFGVEPHTAEVRDPDARAGRYNIPNVALFSWRLAEYEVERSTAYLVESETTDQRRCYTFDPSGRDIPLINHPAQEQEISMLADERHVPGRLHHGLLANALKHPDSDGAQHFFGPEPVLQVFEDGQPVAPERLQIYVPWQRRDPAEEAGINGWDAMRPDVGKVVIDVARGRLVLRPKLDEPAPTAVEVSYSYAFSGDVGGCPIERSIGELPDWSRSVFCSHASSLRDAVDAWNADAQPGMSGVIVIEDSQTYVEDLDISLPSGATLRIVAASRRRPHVRGSVRVLGSATDAKLRPTLMLEGLQLEGTVTVARGNLGRLYLRLTTIIPAHGGVTVEQPGTDGLATGNIGLSVELERSICGPIVMPATVPKLALDSSIIDAAGGSAAIVAPGATAKIDAVTVLGSAEINILEASDSIFAGRVRTRRRQVGCVRFSYLAPDSRTPRRYRCQPDQALRHAPADEAEDIRARLVPAFVAHEWGEPGYAQLARVCPEQLVGGAEDGDQMGVFHFLQSTHREANLRAALSQYLRGGLRVGLVFTS